jgi:CheY-like chemotaxis protein
MPSNILIADDNASIRFLIRSLIESAGFVVCAEAANGTEAIEKANQFQPDLILLDVAMPLLNGAEAASILKKQMPHIPIILFTMHEDSVNKVFENQIGVERVMAKSDGMTKLLDSMRDLLGLPPNELPTIGPLKIPAEASTKRTHPTPSSTPTKRKAT